MQRSFYAKKISCSAKKNRLAVLMESAFELQSLGQIGKMH